MGKLTNFFADVLIRRKVALHKTPLDRYQVRIARSVKEYEDAFRLVHAAYVYQGIESVQASECRVTEQHLLPEATVLVAYEGPQLVGTMTVVLDSSAGLPLDKDYPEALAALRYGGARLVEYGALAVVERCWHSGVTDLLSIAAFCLVNSVLRASHVVIGVNPRAVAFHRAVYNGRVLGAPRPHAELRAPVVGMVQEIAAWPAFCRRHHTKAMQSGKMPVEHFFGDPPRCIALPLGMSRQMYAHWKMPREVLRTLSRRAAHVVNSPIRATV